MAETYEDLYPYKPSLPLALVAAAFFGVVAFLHTYQALRGRTWFFLAFVIGGFFECLGFLSRAFSIHEGPQYTLPPFAASLALILVAPALFAASIYMFLGRIVRLVQAEHHAIIRIGWLTKIFVIGDIISFATQVIGAIVLNQQTAKSYSQGSNIITIGLAIQIVFFGLFLVTSCLFHFRTVRHPTDRSRHSGIAWKKHMRVLYAASAIILVRCIYRFIEYRTERPEKHGYLLAHEWPMYIFDSLLMLAVMVLFFVQHPSEVTALRNARGGVAVRYLSGRHVGPLVDHSRPLPQPVLGPTMYYEAGDSVVRMHRYLPK